MAKKEQLLDVVDFHAHILPGADHGSYSLDESEKQLDLAQGYGVKRIIATPHFYPDAHSVEAFLEKRSRAFEILKPSLSGDSPEVILGAEVLFCNGIWKMPDLDKLFISGTNSILLELPFSGFDDEYLHSVSKLIKSGVDVILAHADRYDRNIINQLIDVGARIQINAGAVCSFFKRRKIRGLFERGSVVALGSDIHGRDESAYKNFSKAISILEEKISLIKEESDKIWDYALLKK